MSVKLLEERTRQYWTLSRQWRGDHTLGAITVGELLGSLADLAGSCLNLGFSRIESHSATLLDQVVNNKRNRKKKPVNNIVQLHSHVIKHVPTGQVRMVTTAVHADLLQDLKQVG